MEEDRKVVAFPGVRAMREAFEEGRRRARSDRWARAGSAMLALGLMVCGVVLLAGSAGWLAAVGVYLMIWANNVKLRSEAE